MLSSEVLAHICCFRSWLYSLLQSCYGFILCINGNSWNWNWDLLNANIWQHSVLGLCQTAHV